MKKLLTAAIFLGLSSIASAATVSAFCGIQNVTLNITNSGASALITCPSFASLATPAGSTYVSTYVDTLSSITGVIGQGIGTANITWSGAGLVFTPVVINASTGALDVPGTTLPAVGGLAGPFNISYSAVTTSGSGSVGAATGSATVTYNYNSPIPEPASLALMGSGLLGIGLIARRRRAKR